MSIKNVKFSGRLPSDIQTSTSFSYVFAYLLENVVLIIKLRSTVSLLDGFRSHLVDYHHKILVCGLTLRGIPSFLIYSLFYLEVMKSMRICCVYLFN